MSKFSPVSYKKLCRVFAAEGFRLVRQEGDHLIYTRAGVLRPVIIPKYSPVPVFIIKNNLRTAGQGSFPAGASYWAKAGGTKAWKLTIGQDAKIVEQHPVLFCRVETGG
jgi:predicted RNA binding protein YcfA (HicA-like mRNA interferase family)